MQLPHFSLSRFGTVTVAGKKEYLLETVSAYEFEFYTEDYPGGSVTDGSFRPVRKDWYNLFRPGQTQRLVAPYKCYMLNILTRDPEMCSVLDNLPDSAPVWNMKEVVKLIRQMMATQEKNSFSGRLRLQGYAGQILALLAEHRLPQGSEQRGTFLHRETLMKVDRYIREHPNADLSLKRLAEISSLDPTYLHKLYTSAYGKSPAQQTLAYRILAAKLALAEGDLPLAEIASRCGFSSQAYFSSKFKQVTGITPTEYRKRSVRGNKKK